MGLLADAFREAVAKNPKMQEANFDVLYPTGFLSFDFLNGYVVTVRDEEDHVSKYNAIGLVDGSSTTIIGRSGCGKTTFALQVAANIVRPFKNGVIFYDDIESGSNAARRQTLTGFTPDEMTERIIYRNSAISAENFYERISIIYDTKLKNPKDYMYDTGKYDPRGNRIYKMVPTIYILDSLAMLTPENITEEEKLSGSMSSSAIAKSNTSVYKRIIPKLKAANIMLLVINHITDKIEINAFSHTKGKVRGLKQGESLPGGNAAIYLANNMIRMDDTTRLKDTEGLGINGTIVDLSIIKSRTNENLTSVPLVFDVKTGFDPDLSLYAYLKEKEILPKGAYMTLPGSDIKFTAKNFKELLYTNQEFQKQFSDVCIKELSKLLSDGEQSMQKETEETTSLASSMVGLATQTISM